MPSPSAALVPTVLAACLLLSACSTPQPLPYVGVASSPQMRPTARDGGKVPYEYRSVTDWRQYRSFVLDPVVIYRGPDQQFEDLGEEDKQRLAGYMQTRFGDKLSERFRPLAGPQADGLRIRLTLTGAKSSTAVLSTLSRFDLAGGPYNAVQAARGKEGAFTGSVSYAVEIFDAQSGALLHAYVAKQYPNAWNLRAGMGALTASYQGIDDGADELLRTLRR